MGIFAGAPVQARPAVHPGMAILDSMGIFAGLPVPNAITIVLGIAAIWLAIAIPAAGVRPCGEQAVLEQIDHEDSVLCGRFGLAARTPEFADCMIALADLRQRQVDLLASYSLL